MAASKGIGRLVQFGVAKETVRGTPNASADYWLPWADISYDDQQVRVDLEQSYGIIEAGIGQTTAKKWAGGTLKCPLDDTISPLFLISLLGTVVDAGNADPSGIVYDHTITVQQGAQHQALSLYIDDPLAAQDYKYGLGVVEGFELNYVVGKFCEISAKLKSLAGATTTNTPAIATINRFLGHHLTFKMASTLAGLAGASATVIRSVKLKIENNVEDDHNLGNIAPTDFVNKQFKITGTVEALWKNESDFKTNSLAGTSQALRFDLKNTDKTIGTSANPEIKIDLANVIFEPIGRTIKLNDMVLQQVNFNAFYSTGDTQMVSIVCTNLKTAY